MFNKSMVTNTLAFLLAALGQYSPVYPKAMFTVGIFAFSGAITNWLAVHMLFEKIPFLYGSGVIPNRFEEFKAGIRHLIMSQFFTATNIKKFMSETGSGSMDIKPILDIIDYNQVFDGLATTIKESAFGPMLAMAGGDAALEPMKEPFILKVKTTILDMVGQESFKEKLSGTLGNMANPEELESKIGSIVDSRLKELTPRMVKEIIQDMIRKHLGWLVVWGGVFGGLIGLMSHYFTIFN